MPTQDIFSQIARYEASLDFEEFGLNVSIPLYVKDHPIPVRKPKITEIMTIDQPNTGWMANTQAVFYGSPEPLQVAIQGWIITPTIGNSKDSTRRFRPVDNVGNPLPYGNVTYAEIIEGYISGYLNPAGRGGSQRIDPTFYTTPFGQRYANVTIVSFDPQYSPNMKKQPFSMTMWLEQ